MPGYPSLIIGIMVIGGVQPDDRVMGEIYRQVLSRSNISRSISSPNTVKRAQDGSARDGAARDAAEWLRVRSRAQVSQRRPKQAGVIGAAKIVAVRDD